jgi:hypothetical protein
VVLVQLLQPLLFATWIQLLPLTHQVATKLAYGTMRARGSLSSCSRKLLCNSKEGWVAFVATCVPLSFPDGPDGEFGFAPQSLNVVRHGPSTCLFVLPAVRNQHALRPPFAHIHMLLATEKLADLPVHPLHRNGGAGAAIKRAQAHNKVCSGLDSSSAAGLGQSNLSFWLNPASKQQTGVSHNSWAAEARTR